MSTAYQAVGGAAPGHMSRAAFLLPYAANDEPRATQADGAMWAAALDLFRMRACTPHDHCGCEAAPLFHIATARAKIQDAAALLAACPVFDLNTSETALLLICETITARRADELADAHQDGCDLFGHREEAAMRAYDQSPRARRPITGLFT